MEKTCTKCGLPKDLGEFGPNKTTRDGLRTHCRECKRVQDRETVRRVRVLVFGHYGTVCVCCGATENLSIDHVNGNGREHRIELFGRRTTAGWMFYRWLIRNGYPEGYQTLCRPCNHSKFHGERCRLEHRR